MKIVNTNRNVKIFAFAFILLFLLSSSAQISGPMIEEMLDQNSSDGIHSTAMSPFDPRVGYRPAEKTDTTMVPKVFAHPELGESIVRTSLLDSILEVNNIELDGVFTTVEDCPSFDRLDFGVSRGLDNDLDPGGGGGGGYAYGVVIVPDVWSIGKPITVQFELHNMHEYSITVTCSFKGKEGTTQEWDVSCSNAPVDAFTTRIISLATHIPITSVGLKTGVAEISGGITFYHQYGNEFVQKFGDLPAPPSDSMSIGSGNPNYYWEGCSNDGFAWSSSYKIFHPESWSVRYTAAAWLDTTSSSSSSVYDVGEELNSEVHDHMTYDSSEPYAVDTAFSDTYIMTTSNYRGVCDDFSVLAASMYRAMGIPTRLLIVYSPTFCHAFLEVWAPKSGSWTWILSDPTWEWYDRADDEELEYVTIYAGFDDSIVSSGIEDGTSTNGRIEWYSQDMKYHYTYDGPNDYFYLHLECDDADPWFLGSSVFETFRTRDSTGTMKVGTNVWGNKYFYCDDVVSSTSWKHGPMYKYDISMPFKLSNLVLFKVDMELISTSQKMGDLIVSLYDDNYDLIEVFCLYDSWYGSTSRAYLEYHYENEGFDRYFAATKYGSWRKDWKFWYDSDDSSVKCQLGSGSIVTHSSSTFNPDRIVSYIGIQFARASTYNYHNSNLRVFDIVLDWKI